MSRTRAIALARAARRAVAPQSVRVGVGAVSVAPTIPSGAVRIEDAAGLIMDPATGKSDSRCADTDLFSADSGTSFSANLTVQKSSASCSALGCISADEEKGRTVSGRDMWKKIAPLRLWEAGPHKGENMPPRRATPEEVVSRFWAKVAKTETCWNWTAAIYSHGYGHFNYGGRRTMPAHRFSFELVHGKIPAGLLVLHSCDNRRCVNPAHLSFGTHRDNTRDMIAKGRARMGDFQRAKTHCKQGHPYDAENTAVVTRDGRSERICRTCRRAVHARRRALHRDEMNRRDRERYHAKKLAFQGSAA